MIALEKKLQQEVIRNCELAEKEYGCKMTRFLQTIERFGIVRTAQEIFRKGRKMKLEDYICHLIN